MDTTATMRSGRRWLLVGALVALAGCDGGSADPSLDGDPALRGHADGGAAGAGAGGASIGSGGMIGSGGAASSVGGHQGTAGASGAGGMTGAGAGGAGGDIAICDPATGYQITSGPCYDNAGQLQHHAGMTCVMCGSLLGPGQFCRNGNGNLCVRLCSDCQ